MGMAAAGISTGNKPNANNIKNVGRASSII
jgi:hypothetical protein